MKEVKRFSVNAVVILTCEESGEESILSWISSLIFELMCIVFKLLLNILLLVVLLVYCFAASRWFTETFCCSDQPMAQYQGAYADSAETKL